jgi:hypothetical protein
MSNLLYENIGGNQFRLVNETMSKAQRKAELDKIWKDVHPKNEPEKKAGDDYDHASGAPIDLKHHKVHEPINRDKYTGKTFDNDVDETIKFEKVEGNKFKLTKEGDNGFYSSFFEVPIPDDAETAEKLLMVGVQFYKDGEVPRIDMKGFMQHIEDIENKFPQLKGTFEHYAHGAEPDREDNNWNEP